ncbi:hypothetical protein ACHAXA_007111 [Cyclostephanos tholiformis]|uniref:Uncharacterized protein n=1 Tax=Cyclostephanos tholiformis TaxID=382380 RepID=A0ABD3RYG2_9STRA
MSSDWRYAKDITRQRLAAAKARASSDAMMVETAAQMVGNATLMLENATRNFKSAKDNLDKSRDEVRAAEALMREAEERWMEIVIDDETSTAPPSNERRRVSASPPTIEGVSNAVTVGESTHGNGNIVAAAGSTSGQSSVGESNAPTMISSSSGGYVAAATAGQSSHGTGNISVRAVVSNAAGNRNVITAVGLTAGGSSVGESNVPAMIVSPRGPRRRWNYGQIESWHRNHQWDNRHSSFYANAGDSSSIVVRGRNCRRNCRPIKSWCWKRKWGSCRIECCCKYRSVDECARCRHSSEHVSHSQSAATAGHGPAASITSSYLHEC